MKHKHYYEINAKDNYELGTIRGELFGEVAKETLEKSKSQKNWQKKVALSKDYLTITDKHFPLLIQELQGYAKASHIDFSDFWTMSLEDDFDYLDAEKCTTIITNNGQLISHNEDWDVGAEKAICVLKKTIHNVTTLELFYYNTLGGASACINSYGVVMTINTLTHTDRQVGVPRNVIARWLSETNSIQSDYQKLQTIPRSLGYNHLFTTTKGDVWNLECSATQQILAKPSLPYVHTNHFLSKELTSFEENDDATGTYERYNAACSLVRPHMSTQEIIALNSKDTNGNKDSIMNERTIGKMVIDLENLAAKVWLRREKELDWVDYPLDFIS